VGEAANTLQDVKEAKAELSAHTGRIEDLIKATKRAGDDVSARRTLKLKKRQKDEETEQRRKRSRNKRQTSKRSRRPRTAQKRSCWLNKR
jgi:hypothetical protein